MNNILVTGGNGQLGSEIKELSASFINDSFFFTDASDLDITNHAVVAAFIKTNSINVIINCAAYTAVDKAESESKLADAINHLAVKNLATVSKDEGVKLIHISTDYVFDGAIQKPYTETDFTNPQTVYGQTKLNGELAMQAINPVNSIIIRTSWLYSSYGSNFVKTMLRLAKTRDEISVVSDQIGTPTNAADLATVILTIFPQMSNETVEIFHYSNGGVCSWYEFAKAIFKMKEINIRVQPIPTNLYPTSAKRPKYSVLEGHKIKVFYGITLLDWKISLNRCLDKFK